MPETIPEVLLYVNSIVIGISGFLLVIFFRSLMRTLRGIGETQKDHGERISVLEETLNNEKEWRNRIFLDLEKLTKNLEKYTESTHKAILLMQENCREQLTRLRGGGIK